jgi:hypothetical protein
MLANNAIIVEGQCTWRPIISPCAAPRASCRHGSRVIFFHGGTRWDAVVALFNHLEPSPAWKVETVWYGVLVQCEYTDPRNLANHPPWTSIYSRERPCLGHCISRGNCATVEGLYYAVCGSPSVAWRCVPVPCEVRLRLTVELPRLRLADRIVSGQGARRSYCTAALYTEEGSGGR